MWANVADAGPVGLRRQEVEGALERRQHAQRQHVDLHQTQGVDVVLVPLDEGAVVHGRIADGDGLVEPALGQHIAADVLRQVAREPEQLLARVAARRISGASGIEARLADVLVRHSSP
jgi:predicted DsbA family dithiol-disulfide isomerase